MQIAELVQPGIFRLVEGIVEDPGPGQVQVKVEAIGICGSDLLSFASGGIGGLENGSVAKMQ